MSDVPCVAVEEHQRWTLVRSMNLLDQIAVQFLMIRRIDGDLLVRHLKEIWRLDDQP